MALKCPVCGKVLHIKYGQLQCECGWTDPTHFKPIASACRHSNSSIKY